MEHHTDAATSHGQLGYTGLEERTAEITGGESVGLLQETVGLIGIGKVGGSDDHVFYMGSKHS